MTAKNTVLLYTRPTTTEHVQHFKCGACNIRCCVKLQMRIEGRTLQNNVFVVAVQDWSDNWSYIECPCEFACDKLKVFLCHVIDKTSPVGIRTSDDWNKTHWGHFVGGLPHDVRLVIVPVSVGKQRLEYKMVSGSDESFIWEPEPFVNRTLILTVCHQVLDITWGKLQHNVAVDAPHAYRHVAVFVTVPEDMQRHLEENSSSKVFMMNARDENDKKLPIKKGGVAFYWIDCHQTYYASVSLPGHVTALRFYLAIMDNKRRISHVDEYSYQNPTYREILIDSSLAELQYSVNCDGFIDVRPKLLSITPDS